MKKKIMLLIAVIPLIFMLTIFSVGKAVSVVVSIPVSGIAITTQSDDGMISLDMATYTDDLYITADVSPATAKNKKYTVDISGVGGEEAADISIDKNSGKVSLFGTGRAKITVTSNENAFTDSVILNVVSSKIIDFTPVLSANGGEVNLIPSNDADADYFCEVLSGDLLLSASVNPQTLSQSAVRWSSDNENVVSVNEYLGKARALLSGSAVVTAETEDGIHGKIAKKIKFNVVKTSTPNGVAVNGVASADVVSGKDSTKASFLVELPEGKTADDLTVNGVGVLNFSTSAVDGAENKLAVTVEFAAAEDCTIRLSADGGLTYNNVNVLFVDYSFGVYTSYHLSEDNGMYHKNGVTTTYIAVSDTYAGEGVTYLWQSSDENVVSVNNDGGWTAKISAHTVGTALIKVSAFKEGKQYGDTVEKTITVVPVVSSVDFTDNLATCGIGGVPAVGDTVISSNTYKKYYRTFPLRVQNGKEACAFDIAAFVYSSSNDSVAKPSVTMTELRSNILSTGSVTFTAKWKYADYFGEKVSSSITFTAVRDGVETADYNTLKKATSDGKAVVLTSDIMLGTKTTDVGTLSSYANAMPTTFDWQYYENRGLTRPNVYYLIEFKNNVYGNGHELNADNITQAKDATGNALLFKGPLDFVAISVAAVKGQDNISFLARTAGVTIDNVVLKGCSDTSLVNEKNEFDLSLLNYVGTTLEVSNSVNVKNCRISNGRTVMRVYGGGQTDGKPVVTDVSQVNAASEKITVNIESCILTNAREFILKTGSNRALMAIGDASTPFALRKLPKADGGTYDCYDEANALDEYFTSRYVVADITLKNSVLATSGLFTIGMDAHFGGEMLSGAKGSTCPTNWTKLAATSYACALHLSGDVKLLDWKKLTNVDSSTLIEITGDLGETKQFLQMDINAMIRKVSTKEEYKYITSDIDGEKYVHGGIAMYGGGYNYSYVDYSGLNGTTEALPRYDVSLGILAEGEDVNSPLYMQGSLLPGAAGPSPFRFYMYDGKSTTNYYNQQNEIESGAAYKVPAAK